MYGGGVLCPPCHTNRVVHESLDRGNVMLLHNGDSFKSTSLEENMPRFLGGCSVIYLFSEKPVLTSAGSQSSAYGIEQ